MGCSGVFCASLYSIERLLADKEVDVFECVRQLRKDKPGIVPALYKKLDRMHTDVLQLILLQDSPLENTIPI